MTDAPYDDYVNKVVGGLDLDKQYFVLFRECRAFPLTDTVWREPFIDFKVSELRSLLADAWMAGLAHSLEFIEPKKSE